MLSLLWSITPDAAIVVVVVIVTINATVPIGATAAMPAAIHATATIITHFIIIAC